MTQPVPLFQVIAKEIRVVGSFRYGPGDFKFAVALVERGLVDLRPLVTQRYSFENALEAFNTTRAGKDLDGNVCWFSFGRAVCRSLSGCYQMHHQWARIAYKVASPAAYLAHILISKCTIGTSLICIQPMLFQLSFANSGFTLQRPWWAGERPMLTRAQHQILCPEEQRVAYITDWASIAVHCGQTRSKDGQHQRMYMKRVLRALGPHKPSTYLPTVSSLSPISGSHPDTVGHPRRSTRVIFLQGRQACRYRTVHLATYYSMISARRTGNSLLSAGPPTENSYPYNRPPARVTNRELSLATPWLSFVPWESGHTLSCPLVDCQFSRFGRVRSRGPCGPLGSAASQDSDHRSG